MPMLRHMLLPLAWLIGCPEPPVGELQPALPLEDGCSGTQVYARADDPGQPGPWPVGVRTVTLEDLTVELLYPAVLGSESDKSPMSVDIRYALPESQRVLISDAKTPVVNCDCYRGLPLDTAAGPYPLVLFVHGTASWRTQSLSLMRHWASRGFVVASADHPGLWLQDLLAGICGIPVGASQDLQRDLRLILDGFTAGQEPLQFLDGAVDLKRVAVTGHSAGGIAAATAATLPGVETIISMAGDEEVPSEAALKSALYLGGMADTVIPFDRTREAFGATLQGKGLMGITEAGHLVFSDLCELTNGDGQNLVEIAVEAGVCGTEFASRLFDCASSTIPPVQANAIVKSASTWVLERDLHCVEDLAPFGQVIGHEDWVEVVEDGFAN